MDGLGGSDTKLRAAWLAAAGDGPLAPGLGHFDQEPRALGPAAAATGPFI